MRTLLIPCAGKSLLDGVPQCIARHPDGAFLVAKSISGLPLDNINQCIITILEEHERQFHISQMLMKELQQFKFSTQICILQHMTSGPAETVRKTIQKEAVHGGIIIKDVDSYVNISRLEGDNFVAGLNIYDFDQEVYDLKNRSFVILNEQQNIMDIIEKRIRSDVFCTGLYGIEDVEDYMEAYDALTDDNYGIDRLYVSHIIAYLIGRKGKVFHYAKSIDYESYGSPYEWNVIKQRRTLYFLEFELLYDWGREEWNTKNLEILQKLVKTGSKIIITTSMSNHYSRQVKELLKGKGVVPKEIIGNCTEPMRQILDNTNAIERAAVQAI